MRPVLVCMEYFTSDSV